MQKAIQTKIITLPNLQFKTQSIFLNFVHQKLHVFTVKTHREKFEEENININLIHNKFSIEQPKVTPYILNDFFHIKGYGVKAIEALNYWFQLFQKEHPKECINASKIQKEEILQITNTTQRYVSKNWIAFNKCTHKNGFYYKQYKNQQELANFHSTIVGHFRTLFNGLDIKTSKEIPLKIKIIHIEQSEQKPALFEKGTSINKYQFSIIIETNWQLPSIFSIGQNIGYGNGIFTRVE